MLTARPGPGETVFGLGSAHASDMRKVVDALPESHRAPATDVTQRFLVAPETDLLSRRLVTEEVPGTTMREVRTAGCGWRLLSKIRDAPNGRCAARHGYRSPKDLTSFHGRLGAWVTRSSP